MNNVLGQAADEFVSSQGMNNYSNIKTQANTESKGSLGIGAGSSNDADVLSILEKH